jgi:hypothetical protein
MLFTAFVPMIPAVDAFFDKVLVMEKKTARDRPGCCSTPAARGIADLSRLEGLGGCGSPRRNMRGLQR